MTSVTKGHDIAYTKRSPVDFWARCACGATPDPKRTYMTRQMVEDEMAKHLRQVRRAAIALNRPKHVSLVGEAKWYRERADDTSLSDKERAMWRTLAEPLERRLGLTGVTDGQPELELGLS